MDFKPFIAEDTLKSAYGQGLYDGKNGVSSDPARYKYTAQEDIKYYLQGHKEGLNLARARGGRHAGGGSGWDQSTASLAELKEAIKQGTYKVVRGNLAVGEEVTLEKYVDGRLQGMMTTKITG